MNKKRTGEKTPVLRVENVSKNFGNVQALKNVSLGVYPGEVLGLLGDNGAGKSTLIKIISGNFHADEGSIYLEGNRVRFDSPAESRKAGIETVYQNSEVCENASVAGNFSLDASCVEMFRDFVCSRNAPWYGKPKRSSLISA